MCRVYIVAAHFGIACVTVTDLQNQRLLATEPGVQKVCVLIRVRQVVGRKYDLEMSPLIDIFHGFSRSLQALDGIVVQTGPEPLHVCPVFHCYVYRPTPYNPNY